MSAAPFGSETARMCREADGQWGSILYGLVEASKSRADEGREQGDISSRPAVKGGGGVVVGLHDFLYGLPRVWM